MNLALSILFTAIATWIAVGVAFVGFNMIDDYAESHRMFRHGFDLWGGVFLVLIAVGIVATTVGLWLS